tara:strand:- start:92 stop:718 length:627 start_codon:yes stop_codon:yes gene_type:complete
MNLENSYWYFQSVIPHRLCDHIVRLAKEKKGDEQQATTGGFEGKDLRKNPLSKQALKNLKKIRDSRVIWLSEAWIYNLVHPFVREANQNANWNFTWDSSEACQFTTYGPGQYYGWHCDTWDKTYKNQKIRKLSLTLTLSDPTEYEGGELEFDFRNRDPSKKRHTEICSGIAPKGSLVVFPSFVWHRVKPVYRGVRQSLVMWNLGYAFK